MIYPRSTWEAIINEKIAALNPMIADNRIFIRTFVSPAVESSEDKLGRLNIPKNLLEYAEIKKEAVFLGAIHRIELFSAENFIEYDKNPEKYIEKQRGAYERIVEKMNEIGF
jgi:MraZ protein